MGRFDIVIDKSWSVIVDGEWYFEGSYEQCCKVVDEVCSDEEFYGTCTMVPTEEIR